MEQAVRTRWWFAGAVVSLVLSGVCYATHVCMDGHMGHPPYTWPHHVLDVLWPLAAATVAAAAWALRVPHRMAISLIVVAAAAARFGVGGGLAAVLMVLEPLLWLALLILCWRTFIRGLRGDVIRP
jgi:hypothetical protein